MQNITIPNYGTFEIPDDRVADLVRFLQSLKAVDVTEALQRQRPPTDPANRLIFG